MRRIFRIGLVVFIFLVLGQRSSLNSAQQAQAAPYHLAARPPAASPILIGEGRDYAAVVVSDLWDMANIQDIYNEKTRNIHSDYPLLNTNRMNLDAANGLIVGTTATDDPYVFMVWPGYPEYQNIYKHYGKANPINADLYRYLMFRMYLSEAEIGDTGRVFWSDSMTLDQANLGISKPFSVRQGWHTYLIDLKTAAVEPTGPLPWAGSNIQMLRINLTNRANVDVKIDWVRLWADDGNDIPKTTISWEDPSGILSLYAVSAFGEQDTSTPIATSIRASNLSQTWLAGIFPPGAYYIYSIRTKDYAVAAFNEPWDMHSVDQIVQDPNGSNDFFESVAALGQELRFTTTAGPNDPSIYFHIDTLNTKIDTSLYKYFTFRLKFEDPETVEPLMCVANLYWFPSAGGVFNSELLQLQGDDQYHIYTFDLSANANWTATGDIALFRLDPISSSKTGQQTRILLDWASLSSEPPANEAELTPIAGWSDQPVTVQAAPQVEFLNPAYDSGGDYATEVLQDPWDMSQPTDVITTYHVVSSDTSQGFFEFLTDGVAVDLIPSGDSQLALRTGQYFLDTRTPIDPLRYRYITHDFIELDPQDTQLGSIHHYIAWVDKPEENTNFNAEVTNESWNRYSLDLATALINQEVGWARPWQQLAYVPYFIFHPDAIAFYQVRGAYDNVRLTAIPWADQSFVIRWQVKTGNPTASVKLYCDTDSTLGNEVFIGQTTLGAGRFSWNTSTVPEGNYYIVLKIEDGLSMERVKYSQVPVAVKRQVKLSLGSMPIVIPEGKDYAAGQQNPWDFGDDSDLDKRLLPTGYQGLSNVTFQNGLMTATSAQSDSYFFLSMPESIDASRYRWLSLRVRSDYYDHVDAAVDLVITWSVDGNWRQSPVMKVYPGWGMYAVDLQQYPDWSGQVDYLRLHLASIPGQTFAVDWVHLTEPQTQTLTWEVENANSNTRVSLYAVPDHSACTALTAPSSCPEGSLVIARDLIGVNSFAWDYGGLGAGQYRVIAVVDDRISALYEDTVSFKISSSGIPLPEAFSKTSPINNVYLQSGNLSLSWNSSPNADTYEYCYDTTDNAVCNTAWISAGANTSVDLSGLNAHTTYYWQVRANGPGGMTYADSSDWWHFTLPAITLPQKIFLAAVMVK